MNELSKKIGNNVHIKPKGQWDGYMQLLSLKGIIEIGRANQRGFNERSRGGAVEQVPEVTWVLKCSDKISNMKKIECDRKGYSKSFQ